MKYLFNKKTNLVLTAAIAATNATTVSAGVYTATLSGIAFNELTFVHGAGTVDPAANPGLYQSPRLAIFGGPGWDHDLFIAIDSTTGEVTDFKLTNNEPSLIYGAGPFQWALSTAGGTHTPGPGFLSGH